MFKKTPYIRAAGITRKTLDAGIGVLKEKPKCPSCGGKRIRPEVLAFSNEMEKELKKNDHKGGWGECPIEYLLKRLREEVDELENVVKAKEENNMNDMMESLNPSRGWRGAPDLRKEILSEAADVANFAMMIAEVTQ